MDSGNEEEGGLGDGHRISALISSLNHISFDARFKYVSFASSCAEKC